MKLLSFTMRLPNGETAIVFPFHVCSKGPENKVFLIGEDDFRTIHNLIPQCALKCNVIVLADCVLNTHFHICILAKSIDDARKFANRIKQSFGIYLSVEDVEKHHPRQLCGIEVSSILIEDKFYLRNTICYVLRNSLDMGINVDRYRWSSYRAYFRNGEGAEKVRPYSTLRYREAREILRSGTPPKEAPWVFEEDGAIDPVSYIDWEFVERIFNNDVTYFMKVLGCVVDASMEQMLVAEPTSSHSIDELLVIINAKSLSRFERPYDNLTNSEKIVLLKIIYHSCKTSPNQLARCMGFSQEKVAEYLGLKKTPPRCKAGSLKDMRRG